MTWCVVGVEAPWLAAAERVPCWRFGYQSQEIGSGGQGLLAAEQGLPAPMLSGHAVHDLVQLVLKPGRAAAIDLI